MNSRAASYCLLSLWMLAATLLLGCGARSSAVADSAIGTVPPASLTGRMDDALASAAAFLVSRQSADGAWRSDVYAPFKDGDALTPPVLLALVSSGETHAKETARAWEYLAPLVDSAGKVRPTATLAYPTYAAAYIALAARGDAAAKTRDAWLAYLRARQLSEELGWRRDDLQFGGWGYAHDPPRKPAPGTPLAPLAEPNLSATLFALEALRAGGAKDDDPAIVQALAFVRRCQNFSGHNSAHADDANRFDDGGFFFMPADPVRNKAGVVGTDDAGNERFASYGSATADGVRALQLCGVAADDLGLKAGWRWLAEHFSAASHPGGYESDREVARESVYYYYCRALATALTTVDEASLPEGCDRQLLAGELAEAIVFRQQSDGSWVNAAVDVREDDPLVATSLAVVALAKCRETIAAADN